MKLGTYRRAAMMLAGSLAAAATFAQTGDGAAGAQSPVGIDLPKDTRFFGQDSSSVRRATAIVNGSIITGTDVDHRVALVVLANGGRVPAEEMPRLRAQVLRNLVDETLQIQAAEAANIKIDQREVDQLYARYAQNFKQTPQQFTEYLRAQGSSAGSIKRQIHGEIAWTRLQNNKIEPFVNVSEDEVKAVIERLNAARGSQEFKVSEIFLSATPETAGEARANAQRIVQQLRSGASFLAYARQFSEASTAAVGGDLGWVRAEQLPDPLSQAVRQLPIGDISDPIAVPGGFSVVSVEDARQVLTADPRDAVLSLKQMTVRFAPGTARAQVERKIQELVRTSQSMGGCGAAEEAAATIGAEVVSNDQIRARDLPAALQEPLLRLDVGQATQPFGAVEDRISVLVLCGRDDPEAPGAISPEAVANTLAEERVNLRARRYLRDLRRDAVVEYQTGS